MLLMYMQELGKLNESKCGRRTKNPLLDFILNPLKVSNEARIENTNINK